MIKGIGLDSVELKRIERIYNEYGERFLNRIYATEEQDYALRYKDPVPRLAARFAAKEACMKALGTGWSNGVRWRDIIVTNSRSGKPQMRLFGKARQFSQMLAVEHIHLSITHSKEHATVVVIFE
jgi:holo-[acyl-carrier protein] synthase